MQNNITFKHLAGFLRKACLVLCVALLTGTVGAQTVTTAGGTNYLGDYSINNPASLLVSFVVENTTATPLAVTGVSTQMAPYFGVTAGTVATTRLYYSSTSLSGVFDVTQPGWTLGASGTATVPAAVAITPAITGANIIIPANTQYRFALEVTRGLAFSFTPTPTPNNFTSAGVILKVGNFTIGGGVVGYAGLVPAVPAGNAGAFFGGTVNLTSTVPCSGTPAPGNTVSSTASACAATPFTLSTQNLTAGSGVTYQWQTATAATGPWTDVTGATGATYTATQSAATFYRVNVTCSGVTTASTPVQVNLTPNSGCYCSAGATSTTFEKIANVQFGTINNPSTSSAGYENFLSLSTDVVKGSSNVITVTGNADAYDFDHTLVWIDFNQNGNFSDAGELVFTSAESGGPWIGNIVIPATANTGATRMRIRMEDNFFGPNGTPCGTSTYGQVEDYTVNIVPCVTATIASQPSAATVTCGGTTTFTVGTAGSISSVQWQYRKDASSPWVLLNDGSLASGTHTSVLTILNGIDSLNGYQFQAVVTGICSGIIFSTPATLTVTKLAPVISPATSSICVGSIQALTLTNTLGNTDLLTEGFNAGIPASWVIKNNSVPAGSTTWFQGNPDVFPAQSGPDDSYAGANFNAVTGNNTISDWLFTPVVSMKNGDVFTFWTRANGDYADRLEVRQSSAGTSTNVGTTNASVGDFTNLLLTINSGLTLSGYPIVWTKYTVTIAGLSAPTTGRMAFRYFVTSGGPAGANSDYMGVDNVTYTSTGGAAQGIWTSSHPNTIYSNPAATTVYTPGTLATTVYVKPDSTRTYNVTYSTLAPCASSVGAITVNVSHPVTGTYTVANKAVCLGGNTSFTSTASAGATGLPILHQWKVSTNGGASYTNIADGGVYSGATTSTLNITGVTTAMNGYSYKDSVYVTVCNSFVLSTAGTLTVNQPPVLNLAAVPTSAVYPGITTSVVVAVNPAPGAGTTYQWTYNGAPLTSATTNTITGIGVDALGTYSVKVTDANGCSSTSANITIRDSATTTLFIYPNPSNGQFHVRYHDLAGSATYQGPRTLTVYDSRGSRVFAKTYSAVAPYTDMFVDISNHGKGIYNVEITDFNGNRIKTGRVLIQ